MPDSAQQVAARCLEDSDYARRILEGDEYPDVRAAIIQDLRSAEVLGFLNPQPEPPGRSAFIADPVLWMKGWKSLPRENLRRLSTPGASR